MITRRSVLAALPAPLLAKSKATAFALIGDRYHNSDYIRTGLGRTLSEIGVTVDFRDETKMLDAKQLAGYELLIVLRDGMTWPDGYPDENTNAAWVKTGSPELVSDPPVPKTAAKPHYWIRPEQGKAVRRSRKTAAECCSCTTSPTSVRTTPTSATCSAR